MPLELPKGFTAIKDATYPTDSVNLIGVLVNYDPPKSTRGTSWALDFTIQDDFASGDVGDQSSIRCRLFRRVENKFPPISGVGDVVMLRGFKIQEFNLRKEAVGRDMYDTNMLVFPSSRIPVPGLSHPFQAGSQKLPHALTGGPPPTIPEQMAVIHMKNASTGAAQQVQQHVVVNTSKARTRRSVSLIKDLQFNNYYDVRAQVVNIYYYQMGGQVDLKVTDYTPNEQMYNYADPEQEQSHFASDRDWKGPYGFLTLNVTLYGANATWASENLANGDYVFMRNMRVKTSSRGSLEGAIHEDRRNPSKVDIRHMGNTTDIEEIDKRREEYEQKRGNKTAFQAMQNEPKNTLGKTSKEKRQAKRERQRVLKQAEQDELEKKQQELERTRGGVNPNGKIPSYPSSYILSSFSHRCLS
jgi:protection-of-telomeres protein 1